MKTAKGKPLKPLTYVLFGMAIVLFGAGGYLVANDNVTMGVVLIAIGSSNVAIAGGQVAAAKNAHDSEEES